MFRCLGIDEEPINDKIRATFQYNNVYGAVEISRNLTSEIGALLCVFTLEFTQLMNEMLEAEQNERMGRR